MNQLMTQETSAFSPRYFALIDADQEQEEELFPERSTPDPRDPCWYLWGSKNKSVN